eukprot:SM000104S09312  [mRNA]  locus=s104:68250:71261:+ [translate_table: standard]
MGRSASSGGGGGGVAEEEEEEEEWEASGGEGGGGSGGGGGGGDDDSGDDEDDDEGAEGYRRGGYAPVAPGDAFKGGRYSAVAKLGWGHFSTVWLAWDSHLQTHVALKVQKSAPHYTEAALDEITLLQQSAAGDPGGVRGVVRLLDHFRHVGPHGVHVCMVFERLGDNLLTLIRRHRYRGLPLPAVRELAKGVLAALDYLHRELSIIHTDLKPENVLLTTPAEDLPGRPPPSKLKRKAKKAGVDAGGGARPISTPSAPCSTAVKAAQTDGSGSSCGPAAEPPAAARPGAPGISAAAATSFQAEPGNRECTQEPTATTPMHTAMEGVATAAAVQGDTCMAEPGGEQLPPPPRRRWDDDLRCKIVDLGNACWTYKQFTSDIQTRQYRCPEVLLGAKYSTAADMWSLACIIFELVTGDVLFDPRSGDDFDRDEDHLALMMELIGKIPRKIALNGKYSRHFFTRHGELRHIRRLRFWPLDRVLTEKYDLPPHEAKGLAEFLVPMLDFSQERRATAEQALRHPWLNAPATAPAAKDHDDQGAQSSSEVKADSNLKQDNKGGRGGRPRKSGFSDHGPPAQAAVMEQAKERAESFDEALAIEKAEIAMCNVAIRGLSKESDRPLLTTRST